MTPTILFTTPFLRYPAAGGYLLCIDNSIKALARISNLHIHSRSFLEGSDHISTVDYYQQFCRSLHLPSASASQPTRRGGLRATGIRVAKRVLGGRVSQALRRTIVERRDRDDILRLAAQVRPDVIWMSFGVLSFPLVRLIRAATSCKLVVHTDAVYSRAIGDGARYARNAATRRRAAATAQAKLTEEHWGTAIPDITTAVSDIDVAYYRRFARSPEQVQLFANVIDPDQYSVVPPVPAGFRNPSMCLVGTFWQDDSHLGGSPMEDATRWFIRSVLPLVRQQMPDIHLYVVGADSDVVVGDVAGPGITVAGRLPSVLEYLCHADIAVAPIRFGSGTRFKILEAGACGTPMVSTALGAEGLPVQHGEHVLIADSAEDFAQSIIRVLREKGLAQRLAANLKSLVLTRFSVAALAVQGRGILQQLDVL